MNFFRILLLLALTASLSLKGTTSDGAAKVTPPAEFFPIYDYQNDWLVYNSQYKNYVPYSQAINEDAKSVSLNIDLLKNRKYFLLVKTDAEDYLFLDGTLQKKLLSDKWLRLSIDSLYKTLRREELLLTIYGNSGIAGRTVLLCNQKKKADLGLIERAASNLINIKPIPLSSFGNFAVLAMLLILILNAWIFNVNPLAFVRLINPVEFFRNDPREQLSKVNKPYSNSVIFFVIIVSMLMSFILIFLTSNEFNLFSVRKILSEQSNTFQFLRDFFLLSAIFFLLLFGKFILMTLVGNMLNLDKLVDTLFLKIIQSSYFLYAALFLLVFMLSLNDPKWLIPLRPYILLPFLFFYIARAISLYVVTKPSASFINLYLFSYLCVIEIIPLIIGIKFAI